MLHHGKDCRLLNYPPPPCMALRRGTWHYSLPSGPGVHLLFNDCVVEKDQFLQTEIKLCFFHRFWVHALFDALAGRQVSAYKETVPCDPVPISPSRFQILDEKWRVFVESTSLSSYALAGGCSPYSKAEACTNYK